LANVFGYLINKGILTTLALNWAIAMVKARELFNFDWTNVRVYVNFVKL